MEMAKLAASTAAIALLGLLALLHLPPLAIRSCVLLVRWINRWLTYLMQGSPPSHVLLAHTSACIWAVLFGGPANSLLLFFHPPPLKHISVMVFVLIVAWSWGMSLGLAFVSEQADNG